MSAVRSIED